MRTEFNGENEHSGEIMTQLSTTFGTFHVVSILNQVENDLLIGILKKLFVLVTSAVACWTESSNFTPFAQRWSRIGCWPTPSGAVTPTEGVLQHSSKSDGM